MQECPVCKRRSSTVGTKRLRDKSKPPEMNSQEAMLEVVMCNDCHNSYIKGELILGPADADDA